MLLRNYNERDCKCLADLFMKRSQREYKRLYRKVRSVSLEK